MPHVLLRAPGHDRGRSLGWLAVAWMEFFLKHGRGGGTGVPVVHTDEQTAFIVDCYALDAEGLRLYDSAFFSRPKGADKSGLASRLAVFEAVGPCRIMRDEDGAPVFAEGGEVYRDPWGLGFEYVYTEGEPMGQPVTAPMVRCLATEKGQTGNVFQNILYNFTDADCLLRNILAREDDATKWQITLPGGGSIITSTSGAASKDGGLETFAVFDETHLYTLPELRSMYDTVRRNLPKRRREGSWFIETTTMYAKGEDSVAEATYDYAESIMEGKSKRSRLLFDHRYASITMDDMRDEEKLRAALRESFGDSLAWNDLDGLVDEVLDQRTSAASSMRYYFNDRTTVENSWLIPSDWDGCHDPEVEPLQPGDTVSLGFDGSMGHRARGKPDATALVAVRLRDGYVEPLGVWEASDDKAKWPDWTPPLAAVEAAVADAFARFDVVAFYCDPARDWKLRVNQWEAKWGRLVPVKARRDHPFEWWMLGKRAALVQEAIEQCEGAIYNKQLRHGNHYTLTSHVTNARRRINHGKLALSKESDYSTHKIDAAVAMVLAWQGFLDATTAGHGQAREKVRGIRVR